MSGGSDLRAASIEERRAKLRAQLEQVEAQLVELRELRKSESADDEHDPEGVSLSSEWSRLEGLKQSRLENLASIDETAERFQRGEATNCDVCGTPIAPARLEALPEATTCINCAD